RTVKPEFNSHEGLSALSCQAHLLAEALLCYADDEGYFNANPGLVRAGTCPLREDFQNISGLLTELSGNGYIRMGTCSGKHYGQIVHFSAHQKISHATPSKISSLPIEWNADPAGSGKTPENSRKTPKTKRKALEILRPEQGTGNREQGREQGTGSPPMRMNPRPSSLNRVRILDQRQPANPRWNSLRLSKSLKRRRPATHAPSAVSAMTRSARYLRFT